MFDPKKDITDLFEKGQKTIDKEIEDKGVEIKRPSLPEFKERVKKTIIENYNKKDIDIIDLDKGYETALPLVPNMNYSLEDVVNLIHEYQKEKIYGFYSPGIYLSALINRVIKESDIINLNIKNDSKLDYNLGLFLPRGTIILDEYKIYPLDTSHFSNLGYGLNGGKIVINGDYEGAIGGKMTDGKIEVKGNLTDDHNFKGGPGYEMTGGEIEIFGNYEGLSRSLGNKMKGGKIIVNGDAEDIGEKMEGGKIVIRGNVQGSIGRVMQDGEILIEGSVKAKDQQYSSIGYGMSGGKITIKGESEGIIGEFMSGGIISTKNVYGNLGYSMKGGEIIVNGDVGKRNFPVSIGNIMDGGIIKIKGNALECDIGSSMWDGEIIIQGYISDGESVGCSMRGGVINIEGSMPNMKARRIRLGGIIYNKGVEVKDSLLSRTIVKIDKKLRGVD